MILSQLSGGNEGGKKHYCLYRKCESESHVSPNVYVEHRKTPPRAVQYKIQQMHSVFAKTRNRTPAKYQTYHFQHLKKKSRAGMCRKLMEWHDSLHVSELLRQSKQLVSWWSNLSLSGGIDLLTPYGGFNIRSVGIFLARKLELVLFLFFFCLHPGFTVSKSCLQWELPIPPAAQQSIFPPTDIILMLTVSPQSAGKVKCDRIVYENSILNFPPEEKSSLKACDDPPDVKCRGRKCHQETKENAAARNPLQFGLRLVTMALPGPSIIWPENEQSLGFLKCLMQPSCMICFGCRKYLIAVATRRAEWYIKPKRHGFLFQ